MANLNRQYQDTLFGLGNALIKKVFTHKAPFVERLTIDPEMAQAWLGANLKNRKPKQNNQAQITSDILEDRWMVTGDTIKVADTGLLLDGQNRLFSAIAADRSIDTFVAFNLNEEVFHLIDIASRRSLGDIFDIRHIQYSTACAAIARFLLAVELLGLETYISRGGALWGVSNRKIEAFYDDGHQAEIATAAFYSNRVAKLISRSLGGGLFAMFARKDKLMAETFYDGISTGAGLESNEPVYLLRERLLAMRNSDIKRRAISPDVAASVIYAWNLTREGRKMNVLRTGTLKSFPEIR